MRHIAHALPQQTAQAKSRQPIWRCGTRTWLEASHLNMHASTASCSSTGAQLMLSRRKCHLARQQQALAARCGWPLPAADAVEAAAQIAPLDCQSQKPAGNILLWTEHSSAGHCTSLVRMVVKEQSTLMPLATSRLPTLSASLANGAVGVPPTNSLPLPHETTNSGCRPCNAWLALMLRRASLPYTVAVALAAPHTSFVQRMHACTHPPKCCRRTVPVSCRITEEFSVALAVCQPATAVRRLAQIPNDGSILGSQREGSSDCHLRAYTRQCLLVFVGESVCTRIPLRCVTHGQIR